MLTKVVKLQENVRFHARPAGMVAKKAQEYQSLILMLCEDQVIDAKKALSIMNASPYLKTQVELIVDGEDEEQAVKGMEEVLSTLK